MHDLKAIYNKILNCLESEAKEYFVFDGNTKPYPRLPKLTDIEVVCLSLTAESLEITSENLLWSKLKTDYPDMFKSLCHRTKFNRRRKLLSETMSFCLTKISDVLHDNVCDDKLIIDSMPIPVCKLAREKTSTVCKDPKRNEVLASKGYSSTNKNYFIGYKLHLITSISGVYKDMLVSSAHVHDSYFLKLLNKNDGHLKNRELLGDRGYIGKTVQLSLFDDLDLTLNIPYRSNQKEFKKYPYEDKIARKTIEVVFSQYCDEFRMKENYAKSFDGFYSRLVTKILAKTIKQYRNLQNGYPINQTKHSMAA